MKGWLSINELAEKTLIPDTTVRRYVAKFSPYFFIKGGSRSKRYEESGVKVLIRIKQLYDSGMESDEVDSILSKEFATVVDGDNVAEQSEKVVTPTLATAEDISNIMAALDEQREFNKLLIEKLADQERYIKDSIEKRDQQLLESIRAMQEEKRALLETAASAESEKRKSSFFERLFGLKKD